MGLLRTIKRVIVGRDNIAPSTTETEEDLAAIKAEQSSNGTPTGAPPYILTDCAGYEEYCSTGTLTGYAYQLA